MPSTSSGRKKPSARATPRVQGVAPGSSTIGAEVREERLDPEQRPFFRALEELLDPDDVLALGRRFGVIERARKLDLSALVEATILALCGPDGIQTSVSVLYEALGGTPVARSSFYDWFDAEFACLLGELAQRAIARVQEVEQRRRDRNREDRLLERIANVRIVDSSSQILSRLCARWSPSTSTVRPAGVKLHAIVALDSPIVHTYEVSPQRVHDSKQLSDLDFAPGTLALYDLGYVNHERERAMIARGVDILRRLKDSEQPIVEAARAGLVRPDALGKPLDSAILAGDLAAEGIVDLDVRMGTRAPWQARLIGIPAPDGDTRWFVTTLGVDAIDAADAQELYALRWEVEIIFKALKSGLGLDQIRARRPDSLIALLHAKVIALALARLLHLSSLPEADDILTPLAISLVLARMVPWLLVLRARREDISLAEQERRLLDSALRHARSRKRERDRRKSVRMSKLQAKS